MPSLSSNKKALFEYDIREKITAGIRLTGHEVKSVKSGHCNLLGSRAIARHNEIFLVGMNIPSFQPGNTPQDHDPLRTRKLLLKKSEIIQLTDKLNAGLNLIPLNVFTNKNYIKIELGLGRRKKNYDKRDAIKKREVEKEIAKKVKTTRHHD